ncbi:hypothetical protein BV25DRAFT_472016 [Artomyces pyxidatus]|uniref:Uncharacterized protein n=1 Tax=Artomyces pyxidatus TaxID=48021 RepID=A0ACB8T2D0_9AGAM|nr:hypothetical protein BV25DRAFT_472016 [Artomyces pyxidatus]
MARGRRKDTTAPPSRSLEIQRAYRDRKAKYVADLEERCRKAEGENERLREELARALAGSESASRRRELAQQCSELMRNLSRAQESVARFQDQALNNERATPRIPSAATELDIATVLTKVLPQGPLTLGPAPESSTPHLSADGMTASERHHRRPPVTSLSIMGSDSECCGGILNCDGLVEETESDSESMGTSTIQSLPHTLGFRAT